jgi:hypothetical protein
MVLCLPFRVSHNKSSRSNSRANIFPNAVVMSLLSTVRVKAAVLAGELDAQIEAASGALRTGFGK